MQFGIELRSACVLFIASVLPTSVIANVTIRLVPEPQPYIEVDGVSADSLNEVARVGFDNNAWQKILSLYVLADSDRPVSPVLGDYTVESGRLIFTPRFPLKPGLKYRAVFQPTGLPHKSSSNHSVEAIVSLPSLPHGPIATVEAIYPTSDIVPENQLKFYIHFSAPMSRGDSYRHIHLLDADAKPVEAPFLELAEELWDESAQRLTLLLDPGRVKQNLKPHIEVGRALAEGKAYTLVVEADWRDARGKPLSGDFRKPFHVAKADVHQPDSRRWTIAPPTTGTREPLVVNFNESLDHAMLQHAIRVSDPSGHDVEGVATIDDAESQWRFRPIEPWSVGKHQLLVDATLEDLAGNSISRAFEVYLPAGRPEEIEQSIVAFDVVPSPSKRFIEIVPPKR